MIVNEINSYLIILIYGSLILLSSLLISNPLKVNKKANFWFGIFLFLWSTFWFEEIFDLTNIDFLNSLSIIPVKFFQFLTPIIFFFSIVFYTNPDFKFKQKELIYTIAPALFLIGLIAQYLYMGNFLIPSLLNVLVIMQALSFITLSYIKIQHHKKRIRLFSSNTNEIDLKWLEYIIIALFILSIFISFYNILFPRVNLNIIANLVVLTIVFFIAYNTIQQKEIFLLNTNERNLIIKTEQETAVEKRKIISDAQLKNFKLHLIELMENQEPYLDSELTLIRLAELMSISPHQISYVINEGFHENFYWFVNRYRVKKVQELLLNSENDHLSILGIAYESGFSSKTSFNTTFKKISSQTPSEFKKQRSSL